MIECTQAIGGFAWFASARIEWVHAIRIAAQLAGGWFDRSRPNWGIPARFPTRADLNAQKRTQPDHASQPICSRINDIPRPARSVVSGS